VLTDLATHPDPDRLAARLHDEAVARPAGLALALVGRDREELLREAAAARQGLPAALVAGGAWQSPRGSYFTARPLGDRATVAFVYPGAFSAYPGVGRESLRLFPATMEGLTDLTADLADVLALKLLYPRSMTRPSLQHKAALEARLTADVPAMIAASMAYAVLYTRIVRQVFGLQPSAALGYSLGEVSMLLALGIWRGDVGTSSAAFRASPLFRTRLAGPLESVREFWARSGHRTSDDDEPWAAYVLLASPAAVELAIEQPPRVFLAIVSAPGEVVVGGDPAACVRLADRLGCERVRLPFPQVLHCPPAETERAELARINRFPVRPVPGVTLTCSASDGPLEVETDALAECIATMATRRLDFVRLVERVYGEGSRIFVELGPGSTCTRLIDSILGEREHLAAAIDRRGADDHGSLFRLLAKLVSHRVRLDLSALAPARR
jgi:PfaB family protein